MKKCISFCLLCLAACGSLISCANQTDEMSQDTLLSSSIQESSMEESSIEEVSSEVEELVLGEDQTVDMAAEPYLLKFRNQYPNAQITKIRGQIMGQSGVPTMVIEGIEGDKKYANKYVNNGTISRVGNVESEITEEDRANQAKALTPIEWNDVLTLNQLKEIAWNEESGELVDWSLCVVYGKQVYLSPSKSEKNESEENNE